MYDPETMDRNLAIGDAGEALFRYWFETTCSGLDDVVLKQFGYNPEGIIADEEKKEMLKKHEDAPDFVLFDSNEFERHGVEADPLVGISINTQKNWYDMDNGPGAKLDYESEILDHTNWGCHTCPRANACYEGALQNLWYNEYNISNDYRLFVDEYGVDVIMVSIISTTPYNLRRKFQDDDEMFDACYRYLNSGEDELDSQSVIDFLDYLAFDQRYSDRSQPREKEMVFVRRSEILKRLDSDMFHVTQSSVGGFRAVACVDSDIVEDEESLVETLAAFSDQSPTQRPPDWYVNQSSINDFEERDES
jgi:hypothetical protein